MKKVQINTFFNNVYEQSISSSYSSLDLAKRQRVIRYNPVAVIRTDVNIGTGHIATEVVYRYKNGQ